MDKCKDYIIAAPEVLEVLHKDIKSKYPARLNVSEFSTKSGRRLDMLSLDYMKGCVRGYEIKVSRQDFLTDKKWQEYLPYCNQFYFVVPKGLILPEELPPEIGLIYIEPGNLYEHYSDDQPVRTYKKCFRLDLKRRAKQHGQVTEKIYDYIMRRLIFRVLDLHKIIQPSGKAWVEGYEFEYEKGLLDIHGTRTDI